jgi:excisionase family DNA binding protein
VSTNLLRTELKHDEWISQAEAARIRGVSRQAIARLVKKGRFQTFEIGGRILLNRSEVFSFKPDSPGRPSK